MPYRRLPNTDAARIRSLSAAIAKKRADSNEVFTGSIPKMELTLKNFEGAQVHYQKSLETQVIASKKFQKLTKDARLYVSHFIQVLNMCIQRSELKSSVKKHYKLDPTDFTVPDLNSIEAILEIGNNIILGEEKRISEGGAPIYNPAIARVKVAYSIFKEAHISQKQYQNITQRCQTELSEQRVEIDKLLKQIWDQTEEYFKDLPYEQHLKKCQEYGMIYYYRKGELKTEK